MTLNLNIFKYLLSKRKPSAPVKCHCIRDYSEKKRKVLDLSWALDGCKLAAAHDVCEIFSDSGLLQESYVWDIENSNLPYCIILPQGLLTCVEYSPRDLELLLGGYCNGQIGLWDVRAGGHPQQMTPLTQSHKESVTDMKWISSKTGLEFYTCSTDGKMICWDSRNLSSSCQELKFELSLSEDVDEVKSYGITCIEYDPSLPHRFMLGTEQGVMLSCNCKFKEVKEMITSCYSTHTVPVINITRNAFFPKLFASCCAWDTKIWSEDLTVSPILTLRSQNGYCTDASWSPSHASFLFVTKTTGHLELWDILIKNHEPIVSFKLESDGLTRVFTKQHGEQLACGTASGCIHLLNIPEYYASTTKQEKNLVAAMIDREGKREKFLEGKTRGQRLREKFELKNMDVATSPRGEICSEKDFSLDDKLDTVENGATEFTSVFDPNLKGDDDDIGETAPEKALFDMQFSDVLSTILNAVKQQHQT